MYKHIIVSGFGVIGTEVLFQLIKKNKKNKIKISIIDKNFLNFPGGIAYSKNNSKFGFFNNPLRLSSKDFQKWVKKNKNQQNLINIFSQDEEFKLKKWLKSNTLKKKKKFKNIEQLYLPRIAYSVFLKEKFLKILKKIKNQKDIKIDFYENEIIKIKKIKKKIICYTKTPLTKKKFVKNKFSFINGLEIKKKIHHIVSNKIVLGHGILPPSYINSKNFLTKKNYIHDFYSEGGTDYLINKISNININRKTKINIIFIGNKAGLLETMQEFENLEKKLLKKINIISISSSPLSLQKAQLSKKYKSYKFRFLTSQKISKIKKAENILVYIKSEFMNGEKSGYNKYDVWTLILKKKIIDKCFNRLSFKEKNVYNNHIFTKLRNLTRYTYPETVDAKIRLEKSKVLKSLKDKVVELKQINKKIFVRTHKSGSIEADIVVNVSGPVPISSRNNEVTYLNSLKHICTKYNERGFISDKYNRIDNDIYAPGTLSSNFNPERKTIIESIVENSKITANHLIKYIDK